MQFRVLRHFRLDEQRGDARIQSRGQPIDHHAPGIFLEFGGVLIAGGQRMPVGDEEITFVLILQLDPILQRTVIIAQMQLPGRVACPTARVDFVTGPLMPKARCQERVMTWPVAR